MKNYIEEVALSGIEGQTVTLNPEKILLYAKAFLFWLSENTGKPLDTITIAVGQDSRFSGRLLKIACFDALVPYGVSCIDCNLSAWPIMNAYAKGLLEGETFSPSCDGAMLITSSNGDSHMNGLKFFTASGQLVEEDLFLILDYAKSTKLLSLLGNERHKDNYKMQFGKKVYNTTELNIIKIYSEYLVNKIRKNLNNNFNYNQPLLGFKITVDASNGTGGFIASNVLKVLGAGIESSQNLTPDGNFFNHLPDPSDLSAKQSVSLKTITSGSILGLLFNSDLSSFCAFDKVGTEIHKPTPNDNIEVWLLENLDKLI